MSKLFNKYLPSAYSMYPTGHRQVVGQDVPTVTVLSHLHLDFKSCVEVR